MEKGKLLVISGPSGAGKGTICNEIFKEFENIEFSVSMTTRSPRPGEVEGKNYFFSDKKTFEEMIAKDEFFEYAKVFGNYYGTPKKAVMDRLNEGKDVILEIDVQGAIQIEEAYDEAIMIFILPPSLKELKKRICTRATESEEVIQRRLKEAIKEIGCLNHYKYVIINDDLKIAVQNLKSIIRAEHLKIEDKTEIINKYREEI